MPARRLNVIRRRTLYATKHATSIARPCVVTSTCHKRHVHVAAKRRQPVARCCGSDKCAGYSSRRGNAYRRVAHRPNRRFSFKHSKGRALRHAATPNVTSAPPVGGMEYWFANVSSRYAWMPHRLMLAAPPTAQPQYVPTLLNPVFFFFFSFFSFFISSGLQRFLHYFTHFFLSPITVAITSASVRLRLLTLIDTLSFFISFISYWSLPSYRFSIGHVVSRFRRSLIFFAISVIIYFSHLYFQNRDYISFSFSLRQISWIRHWHVITSSFNDGISITVSSYYFSYWQRFHWDYFSLRISSSRHWCHH